MGNISMMRHEDSATVLLIDDDKNVLSAYARLLRRAGLTVSCVDSALTAVDLIAAGKSFDAIVSDIGMPGMSGLDFLQAVRTHDTRVPVLLVTGAPDFQGAARAVEHGAFRYMTKPIESTTFVDQVLKAVAVSQDAKARARDSQIVCTVCHEGCGGTPCTKFVRALAALDIVFQPIFSWSEQRIFGYEALVRCREPGFQRPPDLFSAAETAQQVPQLGRRIREEIAKHAQGLPEGVELFVNLHPADILDEELFDPKQPLSQFAARVVLEITERSSLAAVEDVTERMARLRSLGYRIAVDDLGAGYAGLSSFSLLDPDVVKIDMSLVRGVDKSDRKQRVLRSLVTLCGKDLGLHVVCEGIETAEERDAVLAAGCDLFQGYFFAKPGPGFPAISPQALLPAKVPNAAE